MDRIAMDDVVNQPSRFPHDQVVGVVGLTPVKSQWFDPVLAELTRVLDKMAPPALVVFPDFVGWAAVTWARGRTLPYEVSWPTSARDVVPTHHDDTPPTGVDAWPLREGQAVQAHVESPRSHEAWVAARRYVFDHCSRFLLVHDQRNRGMPFVTRCVLRADETVIVRPDGGKTVRFSS